MSDPDMEKWIVIDMTRTQYGEAGRGLYGENYFLGTFGQFREGMEKVCEEAVVAGLVAARLTETGNENDWRLKACAKKVWDRWQKRETEGWCAFCGKPGLDFRKCSACRTKKVFYCCVEHQKNDWKLHKWTCEKNKK